MDFSRISFLVFFSILFTGCYTDEDEETIIVNSEDSVYVFIDEVMHDWYLWSENLPALDILDFDTPSKLVDAMKYEPYDRWSFIGNAEEMQALFTEGKYFGFGFIIRFDEILNLRVALVYEKSVAYSSGIRKGNIIRSINGTPSRMFQDYDSFFDDSPASFTFEISDNNSQFREISLSKSEISQNAVLYENIYNVSDKQTGYLVYDSFLGYSEEELLETMSYFKAAEISELIIDLRYNGGGYLEMSEKLAEMIIPVAARNQIFYSSVHNEKAGSSFNSSKKFETHLLNLNLSRVFFLTSEFTASASELLINGLKPHMNVKVIGQKTYGKPVGMYSFEFRNWMFMPVTTKFVNSEGYGDFFNGLPVDQLADEGLDKNWGDETEPCLSQALYYIRYGSFNPSVSSSVKSADDHISQKFRSINKQPFLIIGE